jgi:hypothetical protein
VSRARKGLAAVGLTAGCAGLVLAVVVPPAMGSDRMQLACADGRVIERANGSSWWGVDHDAGYVSEHLRITDDNNEVLFEKGYGSKGPDAERSTCLAEHFGTTWTVDLVRTR